MDAGIHCCLSIDCAEGELLAAVRSVVRTDCHLLPTKVRSKISAVLPNPSSRGGLAPGALRCVREYIEAHLDEQILVKTLAQIAGFSVYHFARAFKQSVGAPPHRFVTERRMAKAADLIRCTDRSLSEIALSVGCSDQSHLTALFRRCLGETPSAFRRARRSKENMARLS